MKRLLTVLVFLCCCVFALADPVTWSAQLQPADARPGESAQVLLTAKIEPGWHLYAIDQTPGGPAITKIGLVKGASLESNGGVVQPQPIKAYDPNFEMDVRMFEGAATFAIPVKIADTATGTGSAKVSVYFQTCTNKVCAKPETKEIQVAFTVAAGTARPNHMKPLTAVPAQPAEYRTSESEPSKPTPVPASTDDFSDALQKAQSSGLPAFIWFAFVAGLLALLTPCVFPMIPITVSYFSKAQEAGKKTDYRGAVAYCLGIIGTFTGLGLVVTLIFGASGVQRLATNPFVNLALAVLFIVLAANLFGLFEIIIPASLVNKAHSGSRKGGIVGPLLMGLTFTLTSFTCTVPFVGSILVAASQGQLLYPIVGMLAFSTAFALPFFLLALFPQYLAKMPKSGSWLSTVKGFMGFLELAAAVKFLSNTDLVWQLALIPRSIFLSIWAIIGTLAALYLLGWIVLGHDSKAAKIGWGRRLVGLAMFGATFYCLAGLKGGSLGELNAFLPPDPYPGQKATGQQEIAWIGKYTDAVAQAKKENRPMFVNFTGVTCTNCRWMEQNMFPKPEVLRELKNYIPVELYTDRATPEDDSNATLQVQLTKVKTLPVYAIVSPDGKLIKSFGSSTRDTQQFVSFLQSGNVRVASN